MRWDVKFSVLVVLLSCSIPHVFCQDLRVQSLKNFEKPVQPGKAYTVPYNITNLSQDSLFLKLSMDLPEKWMMIGSEKELKLAAESSSLHIASVFVHEAVQGGLYLISLQILDRNDKLLSTSTVQIEVEDKVDFEIHKQDEFNYVFSGDTVHAEFYVENKSNCAIELDARGFKCDVLADSIFTLQPDSVKYVPVRVVTHSSTKAEDFRFQLIVENKKLRLKKFSYGKVKVFPREAGKRSVYLDFPVTLANTFLSVNRNKILSMGIQSSLNAQGFIDKEERHYIGIRAVGPNRYGKSVLGNLDEYYMLYRDSTIKVELGDKMFAASKLSEFSRFGRGVQARYSKENLMLGGYYLRPRFFSEIKNEYSLSAKYMGFKSFVFKGVFLSKHETELQKRTNIFSLLGGGVLFPGFNFETELSASGFNINGFAGYLKSSYSRESFRSSFSFLYAAPDYKGYYQRTSNFQGFVSYSLSQKAQVSLNFRKDQSNSQRDTLFSESPLTKGVMLSFRYQYAKRGNVSLQGGYRARQDRMEEKKFDYTENNITLNISQGYRKFMVRASGDLAQSENLLTNLSGLAYGVKSSVAYKLKKVKIDGSVSYQKSSRYGKEARSQILYGAKVSAKPDKNSDLSVNFKSNYSIEEYNRNRSLLDITYERRFNEKNHIELSVNYAILENSLDANDFSIGLKYIRRFNAPFKKNVPLGHLTGKINRISAKNSEGVIVFLGGQVAITDKEGHFKINGMEPGSYYLILDRGSIGINEIPTVKTPVELDIITGDNQIEFDIIQEAKINGIFAFRKQKKEQSLVKKSKSPINKKIKVFLELSNEEVTLRKVVELGKAFVFDNLLPGNWKLKLKMAQDKSGYRFQRSEYSFELKAGGVAEVKVPVSRKEKKINFMQEGFSISVGKK